METITYIKEPTSLQCGQAVLAMLSGKSVEEIIKICKTDRETNLKAVKNTLSVLGFNMGEKTPFNTKSELPDVCVLSLETPRCWHWSLYFNGLFYDPEHGVSSELTKCNRRYYFKIGDKLCEEAEY